MIVGIVQARFSSRRLPGKVLAEAGGRTLLWHTVTRLAAAAVCDRVVVATSTDPSDDAVAAHAAGEGWAVSRGSLDDVLDRFYHAAVAHHATVVVRATADCPLLDPDLVRQVVERLRSGQLDYASSTVERSFPKGLDVEACTFPTLERAWREAELPSEREHVTAYVWKRPEQFRIGGVRQEIDQSHMRWTVDEPRDLEFVRAVFDRTGRVDCDRHDILRALALDPALGEINAGIDPDEGYRRSLERDLLP